LYLALGRSQDEPTLQVIATVTQIDEDLVRAVACVYLDAEGEPRVPVRRVNAVDGPPIQDGVGMSLKVAEQLLTLQAR
jgi:hypothetical protein